ncbi:MAG: hypothetical protein Q7S27_06270 [Nanoarchaeota archaeon]|nr:hypothetical protein [Nanoarchaeota archaeon]
MESGKNPEHDKIAKKENTFSKLEKVLIRVRSEGDSIIKTFEERMSTYEIIDTKPIPTERLVSRVYVRTYDEKVKTIKRIPYVDPHKMDYNSGIEGLAKLDSKSPPKSINYLKSRSGNDSFC